MSAMRLDTVYFATTVQEIFLWHFPTFVFIVLNMKTIRSFLKCSQLYQNWKISCTFIYNHSQNNVACSVKYYTNCKKKCFECKQCRVTQWALVLETALNTFQTGRYIKIVIVGMSMYRQFIYCWARLCEYLSASIPMFIYSAAYDSLYQ